MKLSTRLLPREKLLKQGAAALSVPELITVITITGSKGNTVFELARSLHTQFPSETALGVATVAELKKISGVGQARAAQLAAAIELGKRVANPKINTIKRPEDILPFVSDIRNKKQEYLVGCYLDSRHQLLHSQTIAIGSVDAASVHPRDILAPAVTRQCAGILVVHNHPSQNPQPSAEDETFTHQLAQACRLFGVLLIDHVIVTKREHFSLQAAGLIQSQKSVLSNGQN